MIIFTNGISVSESDYAALKNDLLDVEDWVQGAIDGKIAACKGRMLAEWMPRLYSDPDITSIPGNESDTVELILRHPEYKTRLTRELIESGDN